LQRWPLHPQPYAWESLDTYVRRLAEVYGVRLETFGRRALGIEPEIVRDLDRAPRQVLERLSIGTGASLDRLEAMRGDRLWARLVEEAERLLATEEGRKALAHLRTMVPSHNS
jgi:TniQ